VISLFVSGCTIASPGYETVFTPGPLQPNNCGTPYQFKRCGGGSRVGVAQPSRPLVVIEDLTGPAREATAPGSYDLIDYSRLSVPDHARLTPALGEPTPERDK
jgi:hypothetical protein